MTTKDEMITEWLQPLNVWPSDSFDEGFRQGASRAWDHRQKEIDELHTLINRISGKLMEGNWQDAIVLVDEYLM